MLGEKQNEIDKRLLDIQDYACLMMIPLIGVPQSLRIMNMSSRPVVMESYTINGAVTKNSALIGIQGVNFDIPISPQQIQLGLLTIDVFYEDIHSSKWVSRNSAKIIAPGVWAVTTEKNERV